ncbi:sugar phosphate isomerase/epimerase [Actinomadura viridis]|uniref:Inosose dehydratase n=1 Tax=Actinomadura viridis TaxID=58110 RepID=A0A931DSJ0_9ACTN|nr:TIM barrel protein [Actinomadura viridis]MBG6093973.1 inosose dehydratase [Actinomadura viridis]
MSTDAAPEPAAEYGAAGMPGIAAERIAGAPISWGVCEVPDWGHQLAAGRVLAEMRDLGLAATEFGPDGFLPADPAERAGLLEAHGLRPVGGFVPLVLHDPDRDPLPEIARALDAFGDGGATVVLAAATGVDGYDGRPALDARGWDTLLRNLSKVAGHALGRGHRATLHPHVGTMVEGSDEVGRVLDGTDVPLCLDTGHLLIGGVDPLALARSAAGRIAHVHLKDVDAALAGDVRGGRVSYTEAVRAGIYRPLGGGDIDIRGIVRALEGAGYDGWYVMEQDTILAAEPAGGTGPWDDVRESIAFLVSGEEGADGEDGGDGGDAAASRARKGGTA